MISAKIIKENRKKIIENTSISNSDKWFINNIQIYDYKEFGFHELYLAKYIYC